MNKDKNYRLNVSFHGLVTDFGWISLNKKRESICGDFFDITENEEDHVLVLSDGLGSGVKANILSTLTARMLSHMIIKKLPIHDAVAAVADTLPVCSVRHLAYSTFTVLDIRGRQALLYQFDNPDAILIRDGKVTAYPYSTFTLKEKVIHESTFDLREDDMLILMSDGVTNAGMGKTTDGGWGRNEVLRFCQKKYRPGMSAQEMAVAIAYAGLALNLEETDDDLTVLALRFCKKQTVNLMIGPPTTSEQDSTYMESFWQKEGKHVICGGTTAKIAARYLRQPLTTIEGSAVDDVPSLMRLPGADLVTEGLLTLERLLEYCEDFREDRLCFHEMLQKKDGAARLGALLFTWATDINVFFGNAYNQAYEGSEITAQTKTRTVEALIEHLRKAGKTVNISFWAV